MIPITEFFSKNANRNIVALNSLLFFFMAIISNVSRWVTTSYFTDQVGTTFLPSIFSINSTLHIIFSILITFFFSKYIVLNIARWMILTSAILGAIGLILIFTPIPSKYIASILVIFGYRMSSVAEVFNWICAAQFFSSTRAKKVYPLLMSVTAAGSLSGYALIALFSHFFSIADYLIICIIFLFLCYFIIYILQSNFWHINRDETLEDTSVLKVIKFMFTTKSWLTLIFLSVFICTFNTISNLQYILSVQQALVNFEKVTSFFGYFGIISSLASLLFGLILSRIILKLGVWDTLSISILLVFIVFLLLFFSGENIFLVSFSRILMQTFTQLGIFAISILSKYSKSLYQKQITSFFNSLPFGIGAFLASQMFYLLSLKILSFSEFSLLVAFIALCFYLWMKFSKGLYSQILISGVEDDLRTLLKSESQYSLTDSFSTKELYSSISKNVELHKSDILTYEISAKIVDSSNVKIILKILNGLSNTDPEIRKKALAGLASYLSLGEEITPWLLSCINDDDIEIAGRSLIMLHELNPNLSIEKSTEILNELIKLDSPLYQELSLNIIRILKLKELVNVVIFSMKNSNEKVRSAAFLTYKSFATIDNDHDIEILKTHLNEQNMTASKTLISVICDLVKEKRTVFYDLIFSSDPFIWKNASELLIKWNCYSEYKFIVLSAVNKVHLVYENLELINFLVTISDVYHSNILIQHLISQNEMILKGAIYIAAFKADDLDVIDSLYKEVRNVDPNIKETALALIEHLGDKPLTKHLIAYFSANSTQERLEYAKNVLHVQTTNKYNALETLLLENNAWVKMCTLHIMLSLKDPYFEKIITHVFNTEKDELVKNYAEKALTIMHRKDDTNVETEIDFLDVVVFLKNCTVFKYINLNATSLIGKLLTQKNFKKGETIIACHDAVLGMYIVFEGEVSITNNSEKEPLAILQKHAFFGIHYAIQGLSSCETITAHTDTIIFFIPNKVYQNIVVLYPDIMIGLLKEITAYICLIEK